METKSPSFWKNLIAAWLVLAIVTPTLAPLPALALLGDLVDIDSVQPVEGPPVSDNPETNDTFTPPAPIAPLAPGRPKNPAQVLADRRRDDLRACQAEAGGGGSSAGGAADNWLQDKLAQNTGQAMPGIMDSVFDDLPAEFQRNLQRELPSIIDTGLKKELPLRLAPKMQGKTLDQLRAIVPDTNKTLFAQILEGEVSDALPDILKNGTEINLPRLVDQSVRGSLGRHLGPGLNSATEIFVRDELGGQIGQTVSDVFSIIIPYIEGMVTSLNAIGEGMLSSGQSFVSALGMLGGGPLQFFQGLSQAFSSGQEFVSGGQALVDKVKEIGAFLDWLKNRQANQAQLTEDLIQGLTVSIQESMTQGGDINRLSDTISSDINGPISLALEGGSDQISREYSALSLQAIDSPEFYQGVADIILDAADNDNLFDSETNTIISQNRPLAELVSNSLISASADGNFGRNLESRITSVLTRATERLLTSGAISPIALRINIVGQKISDYFLGNTDVVLSEGAGILSPTHVYDSSLPVGVPGSPLAGPPSYFTPDSDTPLGPVIDDMSVNAADTATTDLPKITEGAVANQTGTGSLSLASSAISETFLGAVGSTFASGLTSVISTGNPAADALLRTDATKAFEAATTATGLTGAAEAGAAIAVPVSDAGLLITEQSTNAITGQIKSTQDQIKQTQDNLLKVTTEIKALQIESCTYLKTLKRIQYAFEEKEFLQDPDAKKAAGRAIEYHNIFLFNNLINTGRGTTEGLYAGGGVANFDPKKDRESLIPNNTNEYIAEVRKNEALVIDNDLENSNSLFKNQTRNALTASANQFDSTITQEEYDKITGQSNTGNNGVANSNGTNSRNRNLAQVGAAGNGLADTSGGTENNFSWDLWLKLIQPQNNPAGAEYLAREELARRQAVAEQNAREELLAGGGFLNTGECLEPTPNGGCRRYKTNTPGSLIQGYGVAANTSIINQLEQNPELLGDYNASGLSNNLENLKDIRNYGVAGSIYDQDDPCPGPEPCSDSGWGKIPQAKPVSSTGGGGVDQPANPISGSNNYIPEIPPILNFKPLTLIMDPPTREGSITTIKWKSTNAEECRADNNWLGTAVTSSQILSAVGEQKITHPVAAQVSVVRADATGITSEVPLLKVPTANNLMEKVVFDPTLASPRFGGAGGTRPINAGDVYSFNFAVKDNPLFDSLALVVGGPGVIKTATAAGVVSAIQKEVWKQKASELPIADELNKYNFTYNLVAGTITITPKLTYGMSCYQGATRQPASVTLTR